jgi:hypothetical protein
MCVVVVVVEGEEETGLAGMMDGIIGCLDAEDGAAVQAASKRLRNGDGFEQR